MIQVSLPRLFRQNSLEPLPWWFQFHSDIRACSPGWVSRNVSVCHEYSLPVLRIDLDLEGGSSAYIATFVASIRSLSRESSKKSVTYFIVKTQTRLIVPIDIISRVHRNVLSLTHTSDLSSTLSVLKLCKYVQVCCQPHCGRAGVQISVSVRDPFFSLFTGLLN